MSATPATARQNGKSSTIACADTGSGVPNFATDIIAQRGSISVMSMMFAPMTLPTDKSDFFLAIAVIVVTSSGRDVPTPVS